MPPASPSSRFLVSTKNLFRGHFDPTSIGLVLSQWSLEQSITVFRPGDHE